MKPRLVVFLFLATSFFLQARADTATWNVDPVDGNWNNTANWTPRILPATAIFGLSNQTDVFLSARTTITDLQFSPDASAYTITMPPNQGLIFDGGSGIRNQSSVEQNFVTAGGTASERIDGFIDISFASLQNVVITNKAAADGGALGGLTRFNTNASVANSVIVNEGATVSGAPGGLTFFVGICSANNTTLIAEGGSNGGEGGHLIFGTTHDSETARIQVFGNGELDISGVLVSPITLGSLEGDGVVFLGSKTLNVGANNLNTTFSGLIESSGALIKSGTGTLTLSGASTYTGTTTVMEGTLKVANRSGSSTGTGAVSIKAGKLVGGGLIAGPVTIGIGHGIGASLAPGQGASQPTTLTLQSSITFKADATYTYKLNTKKNKADQVIASGEIGRASCRERV